MQVGFSCWVYKWLEFIPWCKTIQKGEWMLQSLSFFYYAKLVFILFISLPLYTHSITIKVEHKENVYSKIILLLNFWHKFTFKKSGTNDHSWQIKLNKSSKTKVRQIISKSLKINVCPSLLYQFKQKTLSFFFSLQSLFH